MSYRLPLDSHPARELFDVAQFAHDAAPERRHLLPGFAQCAASLRKVVADTAAVGAAGICWRANGDLVLIQCGRRGGIQQRWNFSR